MRIAGGTRGEMGPQARQQARGGGPDRVQRRLAVEPRQIALEEPHRGVLSCRRIREAAPAAAGQLARRSARSLAASAARRSSALGVRGARSGRRTCGRRLARPAGSCRSDPGLPGVARERGFPAGGRRGPVRPGRPARARSPSRRAARPPCRSRRGSGHTRQRTATLPFACARRADRRLTSRIRRRDGVVRAAAAGDRHKAREERDEAAAAGHRPWGWRVTNEPLESSYWISEAGCQRGPVPAGVVGEPCTVSSTMPATSMNVCPWPAEVPA